MEKSRKLYYTISELSEMLDISQSNIRHWEKEITVLKPHRNEKGSRRYTPKDVELLKTVYYLVKVKGLKLEGVNKYFATKNIDEIEKENAVIEKLESIKAYIQEVILAIDEKEEIVLAKFDE